MIADVLVKESKQTVEELSQIDKEVSFIKCDVSGSHQVNN